MARSCLLSGAPGYGKTLFARALAASCGATLVTGSHGQWLGSAQGHQGDLLKAMKQTFALARSSAPSILFIDDVDSLNMCWSKPRCCPTRMQSA